MQVHAKIGEFNGYAGFGMSAEVAGGISLAIGALLGLLFEIFANSH